MIGYATIYTMAPVFSLVLDTDVNEDLALIYPELYKELTKVCVAFSLRAFVEIVDIQIPGSSAFLQDIFSMVDDQRISRSAPTLIHSRQTIPTHISDGCRRGHHACVPRTLRD